MIIWGINANNHDASISVIDSVSRTVLFAGHAERYSRVKNDHHLNAELIADARRMGEPDRVCWFENPYGRRARYLRAGQFKELFTEKFPRAYLKQFGIKAPLDWFDHHESHAAGGFYTSKFDEAAVLVIDAVGELTTASIWQASALGLQCRWRMKYPQSIGLFYSAVTDLVGLKPNEEEYILMGMAAYGSHAHAEQIADLIYEEIFLDEDKDFEPEVSHISFHRGMRGLHPYLDELVTTEQGRFDLALAAQQIIEEYVLKLVGQAKDLTDCNKLVYSGGVALNCVANSLIAKVFRDEFEDIWIMPNPGDAGNSLGAAAAFLEQPLNWYGPALGHYIDRELDVDGVVNELLATGIAGVANGAAEFGPRAFGHRSLLADPRTLEMKDKVNTIKRRQKFRPFAPACWWLEAKHHFELPGNVLQSPYMQYVCRVLDPQALPAITHADGTARLQTVTSEFPGLLQILLRWKERTGCPVLLNTSLNIKGEPLVNTWTDAERFSQRYGVKVF